MVDGTWYMVKIVRCSLLVGMVISVSVVDRVVDSVVDSVVDRCWMVVGI